MKRSIDFYHWLAGTTTGIVVVCVSALVLWQKPLFWEAMAWQAAIMFCVVVLSGPSIDKARSTINQICLWIVLPLIFALSWRVPVDLFFIYTIIWMACAVYFMPKLHCWLWLLGITVAWYFTRLYAWQEQQPLIETVLLGTFHAFAMLSSMAAKEATEANAQTQKLNRELLATQHLLGEASRESERTRIARDLHDLLGHHLTALTINLQVAGHITEGEAKEKVDQCYSLSKLLLNDVRDAVSALRDMPIVNVKQLLSIAVRDIPRLDISLDVQDDLALDDVNTAEVLLRLVQEAITNTLKHTTAQRASIKVHRADKQLLLEYTDTGTGCESLNAGNGIKGMRERLQRLGGELQIDIKPNFVLRAKAPLTV